MRFPLGGWVALLASIFSGSVTAEEKPELEGTWAQVSSERAGVKMTPKKDRRLIITGEKFVIRDGEEVFASGTWKFDAATKPKSYDGTYSEGPNKGVTFKGIYKLDGETVTMCGGAKERPTEFKTTAESGGFLVVYRRVKP